MVVVVRICLQCAFVCMAPLTPLTSRRPLPGHAGPLRLVERQGTTHIGNFCEDRWTAEKYIIRSLVAADYNADGVIDYDEFLHALQARDANVM